MPFSFVYKIMLFILALKSTLSALTRLIVSIEITSMFVSDVALALKLTGSYIIAEYWPRIEPDTVMLSSIKSS